SELGDDGGAWRDLFAPLVENSGLLTELILGNRRELPPGLLGGSGLQAAAQAAWRLLEQGTPAWQQRFTGQEAPALFTGGAAGAPAARPSRAGAGPSLVRATRARVGGGPTPVGGSGARAAALVADLGARGGQVHTGAEVNAWHDLPRARTYVADVTPSALVR